MRGQDRRHHRPRHSDGVRGCKEYPRLDRPENTTKSRQRRLGRMPPSVAVSFVEEATRDGLSEGEMILLSKFEHALHCFLAFRLASCGWRCLDGRFLGEGKEIRFQGHAPGMSARKETRFDLGPQVNGDGHGNLSSKFTPAKSLSLITWVPGPLLFLPQAYLEDC